MKTIFVMTIATCIFVGPSQAQDLMWCRPKGFDRPVTAEQCASAPTPAAEEPEDPQDETDRQAEIEDCVSRVASSGYVQRHSGEIYQLCATGSTHPLRHR